MTELERLKDEGVLDLIFELGQLTDEELEALTWTIETGMMGVA